MKRNPLPFPLLAGIAAFVPLLAHAQDPVVQGRYAVAAYQEIHGSYSFRGCVAMTNDSPIPQLFNWGDKTCRSKPNSRIENRWNLYKVGNYGHVIKSPVGGACLSWGNHGVETMRPSLYLWAQNPDKTYCGLSDSNDFEMNGQAHWYLDVRETRDAGGLTTFVGNAYLGNPWTERFPGRLAFAPTGDLVLSTTDDSWTFFFNTITP